MIYVLSILLIFSSHFSQANDGTVINHHMQRLERASYILRGKPLAASERVEIAQLASQDSSSMNQDFKSRIEKYVDSMEFNKVMKDRIDTLMQFRQKSHATSFLVKSSYDIIVDKVLSENLSWDQLLLSQKYHIAPKPNSVPSSDIESDLGFFQFIFYKELEKHLISLAKEKGSSLNYGSSFPTNSSTINYVEVHPLTDKQKLSLAGIITTNRFFQRYQTTKINKNRRRAAAIFRVFLCDPMKPIILIDKKEDKELLNRSLKIKRAHNSKISSRIPVAEKLHGSDPQCMACHYKLDPMADMFASSSLYLSPFASSGRLVYKNSQGTKVDIETSGLREMVEILVQQQDYASCQTRHFWQWFIGSDSPLSENTEKELLSAFDRLGRKPKDFAKYLVLRPEFSEPPSFDESTVNYSQVQSIFKRCDTCHAENPLAPTLSEKYPFEALINTNLEVLQWIVKDLDLSNNGEAALMPPKSANWKLNPQERDLIRAWLKGGARDSKGGVHISSLSEIKVSGDLDYEVGFSNKLEPSFYNTYRRLVSGDNLNNALKSTFPKTNITECNHLRNNGLGQFKAMLNSFGYPIVATGLPLFKYANPGYLKSWIQCVSRNKRSIDNYFLHHANQMVQPIVKILSDDQKHSVARDSQWSSVGPELQGKVLDIVINHVLYRHSLSEKRIVRMKSLAQKKISEVIAKRGTSRPVLLSEAMSVMAMFTLISEEFLTY